MTALNKQAEAGDVSQKTYYIHPAAFGGTKDPGHGHVPVVKADDFEKLLAKLEAAEKRIAELEARTVTVKLPSDYRNDDGSINADMFNTCAVVGAFREVLAAAGIGVKGE